MKVVKGKFLSAAALILSGVLLFGGCGGKNEDSSGSDGPFDSSEQPYEPDRTVTETKLVTYEGPNLLKTSPAVGVNVEGEELFVYDTRVNHNRLFSYTYSQDTNPVAVFDFEGRVSVTVTVKNASSLTDVTVRPLSYGIEPEISGNRITFDLQYSANYTVEYSVKGEPAADNAVHIFANPLEENPIDPENVPDDVIYIGPGVYEAGAIPMQSGKTLYLAGGAYVYGQIRAEALENITIRGRGILSGEIYDRTKASEFVLPIELRSCKNVKIEGISILDPAGWAVTLYFCDGVEIDNLKIITARANGDGISVQSSKNVQVTGGFVRTWDDSLVVKNSDQGTTKNVTFDNVVVWTDLAQSCEVGYETWGATMEDITFKNITILHNYHKAAMSIHNSDDAVITNVQYRNITVEEAFDLGDNQIDGLDDYLIDITIAYNENWTHSGGARGRIDGVTFENIDVLDMKDSLVCRVNGESNTSAAENISFKNITIKGEQKKDADALKVYANTYTKNISVSSSRKATGATIYFPYKLDLKNDQAVKTRVPGKTQTGLEVPDFSIIDIAETYMGVKLDTSKIDVTATHGTGTTVRAEYDDGSGVWETAANPLENLFDGKRSTAWVSREWTGEADEFVALTIDFKEKTMPGVLRLYLDEHSAFVYDLNIGVFNKRTETAESFARVLSTAKYSLTPAKGNYVDVKLPSTLESYQLQLRIYRGEGMRSPKTLALNEIAFYPAALSTNKPVEVSDYNDVYDASNLVDGNENTYWESKNAEGAFCMVDLGQAYNVKYVIMHLPPLLTWEPRGQEIEILASTDKTNWTAIVPSRVYTFDPSLGNVHSVKLENAVNARYIKLVWKSNTSLGGYGAQLSELYVYGE